MPKSPAKRRSPAPLGTIERLPSGRFRAYYRLDGEKFPAPKAFDSQEAATEWLAAQRADRALGTWRDPRLGQLTLAEYAEGWLASRTDLAPRTRQLYRRLLDTRVLSPAGTAEVGRLDLAKLPLNVITPPLVRTWFARMSDDCARSAQSGSTPAWKPGSGHGAHPARAWAREAGLAVPASGRLPADVVDRWRAAGSPHPVAVVKAGRTGRTSAAQVYRLLHAILAAAVQDGVIAANPVSVKGAGTVHHPERETATPAEVSRLAELMPPRLAEAVWLAAWSGLRQGELLGLARQHLDLQAGTVRVERALGRDRKLYPPKTRASVRTVHLPGFVVDQLATHLERYTAPEPSALVFTSQTGRPMDAGNLVAAFGRARVQIGRPNLTWHDLRHTGATFAYVAGGSVRDVQHRLGHATARAAMIYAHTADDSDRRLAERLDAAFGTAQPTPPPTLDRPGDLTSAAHPDARMEGVRPVLRLIKGGRGEMHAS